MPRAPEVLVREIVARLAMAEEGDDVEQARQDGIYNPNCPSCFSQREVMKRWSKCH